MGNSPSVSAEDEQVLPAHLWEDAFLAAASDRSIDPSQPVMESHSLNNSRRSRMPPGGPRESDPQPMTAPLTYRSPSGLAALFIPDRPIIPTLLIIKNESPDPEEQQRNSWLIQLRSKELAINDSSALVDQREADVRKREIQLEEDARQLRVKHEALKGREHNLGLMDAVAKHFEDKFTAQQAKIDEKVSRKHAQEIANLEQKLAAGEADYEQIVDESKNAIDWLKANLKRRDDEINTWKLFEADAYGKFA